MVMLSQFVRFELVDRHGRHATLLDCAVALLDAEYPPVTRLLFRYEGQEPQTLPWRAVQAIDWRERRIRVADPAESEPASLESLGNEVLLSRDVLDALILDLQHRRATRANDLWLEEANGWLSLRAADTSARAIVRRVSRGLYGRITTRALYDWRYVECLRGNPQAVRRGAGYHRRITRLPPAEIARLMALLPYLHAAELITLLPAPLATDTLEAMSPEQQLQVFEELEADEAVHLLALMAPNLAADLVGRLPTPTARRYLEWLSKPQSERIIELLRYPEDTVGGIMTSDVVFAEGALTVDEARRTSRERLKEPDFVSLIYVVETTMTRRLRGVISLRSLLTADDAQRLEELMDPYVAALHPLEPSREAAYRVINSHLVAMPVVGHEGQLLGVVTVDAAVAEVAPAPMESASAKGVFMNDTPTPGDRLCHQRGLWDPEGREPRRPARARLLCPGDGADQPGSWRCAVAECADHPLAPVGPGAQRDVVAPILVFILRLSNDPRLTGDLKNTRVPNLLGWGTVTVVAVAVVVMLGGQLLDRLGLDLFHTESIPRNHSALD
jgi:magnesium transporter